MFSFDAFLFLHSRLSSTYLFVMSQSQAQLNMGRVKVGDIREVGRQEFLDLLDQFTGTKVLVWDQALTGPMGLVAEYSLLKEHEVR